ncbi:hypothetical protein DMH04_30845 [Kibdelosporangium aridum]|uniref:Uncharacterized protein n=1 Tax=Kibdelosporangium aridum TaxID=2030 RepID=A0A428Z2T9_KIBAR|nr:hypothetical protein DMH04_30845 [Kibdelosporangium aridum]
MLGRPRLPVVSLSKTGACSAQASGLLATTSLRPLRTKADDSVMESSSHWTRGGTATSLRRDGVCAWALAALAAAAVLHPPATRVLHRGAHDFGWHRRRPDRAPGPRATG